MSSNDKILVVDKSPLFVEGIRLSIEKFAVPGRLNLISSHSSANLTSIISNRKFDLIIIDEIHLRKYKTSELEDLFYLNKTKILAIMNPHTSMNNLDLHNRYDGIISKKSDSSSFRDAIKKILSGEKFHLSSRQKKKDFYDFQPIDLSVLTRRETEVLGYVAIGYLNKQIAIKMNITEHTIKSHISRIMKKQRVANRTTLVLACLRSNLPT